MKINSVIASLTLNNDSSQGHPIGIARIDLSYKNEEIPFVTKDVANAHCMQFMKRIFENRGVFMQMSGCALSHNKKTGRIVGSLHFDGEHQEADANIADEIGEFWCKKITGGMGSYRKLDAEPSRHTPLEALSQARGPSRVIRTPLITPDQVIL